MSEITVNLFDEILKDPEFVKHLRAQIDELIRHRELARKNLKPGQSLRRSNYDHLQEAQLLNTIGLIAEFNLMREKKSKLPSSVRGFIELIIRFALQAYFKAKSEAQTKEQAEVQPKPKRKPKAKKAAVIE